MANSPLYDHLMTVLREGLAPHGFRRKGTTFTRDVGEVLHVITVQRTVPPTPTSMEFTVNVGVWSKAIGTKPPASTTHCHVSRRVAHFLGRKDDLWWTMEREDDVPATVRDLLIQGVLPQLDPIRTAADLLDAWRVDPPRLPLPYPYERERYFGILAAAAKGEG